jgi:hypothetical protein
MAQDALDVERWDKIHLNYPPWMQPLILKYPEYNTFLGQTEGKGLLIIHDRMILTPDGKVYIDDVEVDFSKLASLELRVAELERKLACLDR